MQASSGQQQAETRSINTSLSAFNTCLHALWRNQHEAHGAPVHVPVRDSMLTRILADMMNGYGRLVVTAHFSMDEAHMEQSRRTLEFAQRVAQICTRPDAAAATTVEVAAAQPAAGADPGKRAAQAGRNRQVPDRRFHAVPHVSTFAVAGLMLHPA
jgi:Kinesin motor domain